MLLCVSASHKTASFDLLERLSVPTTPVAPLIAAHHECVQGAVVVATCNRFEAYVDMDEPVTAAVAVGVEATLSAIEAATGVPASELAGSYTVLGGGDVAEHLFSVASGLESVVVGEGEIAGQVRRALTESRTLGTTSGELERLFQRASEAQRGVKNSTAIGRAGRSLVRLGLELADSRIADWSTQRVLLVGTGAYAAATVAALRDQGAEDISVHSPSGRAAKFAAKHGLRAVSAETFPAAVAHADLVITCTTSEHHVVSAATFAAGRTAAEAAAPASVGCPVDHSGRRLVVDLGLPRNVDPDVATVPGVDLLDLETIRLHAPLEELQATDAARDLVRDAARRFASVGERKNITPAVVALRAHVFGVLDAEVERVRARGDEDGQTEQALRHLVGVLLHTPTTRAHELAESGRGDEYVSALSALFGIEVADAETPASRIADAG
ncbi:MAG: glutamyl-tRNA reductase [Microbacterium sp. 71-36]|uniref:glutamyl-tRNA reductase n=1 Tax=unclassified Microbacterium TaxID=2609290 RepID=UPI0008696238|nr:MULTISPECIES: glutamyl-tRNA reductase [unclassified Microbacterium]MBN9212871.1 glutamyl-tRNA reductase [Microbacterium sp.]ODT40267.1 MAG: glutamyl-tRNA reductase [Microbacterium sp. SCN 71-17]ODU51239.1 MAG: glutamyl-tRNA reductase [Microbacterium sp. SCN 70-10]OJV78256.1 MAG: glutamyl-tRNA reductase [Microbacterium sp. 71-36]